MLTVRLAPDPGSKLGSMPRMWPSPRSRSDSSAGASSVAAPPPVGQLCPPAPYALAPPAPAYAGWGCWRARNIRNRRKAAPPMSTISRSPTPPPKPPPRPPNSIEPINPPRARPASPPMRPPPNMPGRCCWDADGVGVVTCEGLEGLDGVAGDEYEREPRLPPLLARANTAAVSRNSSDISVSTAMSRSALGFMGYLRAYSSAVTESAAPYPSSCGPPAPDALRPRPSGETRTPCAP